MHDSQPVSIAEKHDVSFGADAKMLKNTDIIQNSNRVLTLRFFRLHCSRPHKVILGLIVILYCMDGSYKTCFEFIRFNNTVLGTDQMARDLRLDLDS